MTSSIKDTEKTEKAQRGFSLTAYRLLLADYRLFLLLIPLLYLFTLARTPVLGDPTEYTFIANVLGIAHPPGYAFITVLGKLLQTLIPLGSIAWRMHLLAAVSGTVAALFVYGTVRTLYAPAANLHAWVALFAALVVGTAVDHWQHSIHANPHIITATFTAANLYFLTRWWSSNKAETRTAESGKDRWLYVFCLSAGLGVTQHPLTVFGFPAYTLFILAIWFKEWRLESGDRRSSPLFSFLSSLLRRWPTILKMFGFALLGLSVWLYYPLRSPHVPFGPTTMNTLNGFLDHVLARGLSESLPYFSLAEQPQRLLVFWSILHLQFSLPIIALAIFGLFTPLLNRQLSIVNLYTGTFLCFYAFVISLRAQDIMAYILGPMLIVGLLAGIGLAQLLALLQRRLGQDKRPLWLLTAVFFLLGPTLQIVRNAPVVSLANFSEGSDYIQATFDWFAGTGQQATAKRLGAHDALWYSQFVDERWPDAADMTPIRFHGTAVAGKRLCLFARRPCLSQQLSPRIVDAGFRLRPRGPFYQVVEPGDATLPPELTPTNATGEEITVVGYALGATENSAQLTNYPAGSYLPITLAMSAPLTPTAYYVPTIHVGTLDFTFTTDSHLLTPTWQPGEIIVERFDVALPLLCPAAIIRSRWI
ncbi:MAG: DUF2723 domain-containing protein [Ardenticatenaceae bacterium]|nr:DUF2723 domain-containing protein [Ardenticatenaceae bacterium]